jgi:hypothetical protein
MLTARAVCKSARRIQAQPRKPIEVSVA